jgi:hypothetical protein
MAAPARASKTLSPAELVERIRGDLAARRCGSPNAKRPAPSAQSAVSPSRLRRRIMRRRTTTS